jgi:alcohol dehydrogenase class IV
MIEFIASPSRIVSTTRFDAESLERLFLYSGIERGTVLFIIDPRPFPVRDRVLGELQKRRSLMIMDQVVPNPTVTDIMAMAEGARKGDIAAVVGVGGGSTLDSAKAVAMLRANDGDLEEYLGPEAKLKAEHKGVPLLLIPTTTGTGSEVTRFGVYTSRSQRKYTLASPYLQADVALLCEELVADLPAPLVAATGYDALTHALETLWNKNGSPLSSALAERALEAVLRSITPAWREAAGTGTGTGTETGTVKKTGFSERANLLRAATLAGIAFNTTGTAAIHALSFIVSEEWHLSHGAACAFFAEDVFDVNSAHPKVREILIPLGRRIFDLPSTSDEEVLRIFRRKLVDLKEEMGLPSRFSDLPGFKGVHNPNEEEALVALFDKTQGDVKLRNNIVALSTEDVRTLVRKKLS